MKFSKLPDRTPVKLTTTSRRGCGITPIFMRRPMATARRWPTSCRLCWKRFLMEMWISGEPAVQIQQRARAEP